MYCELIASYDWIACWINIQSGSDGACPIIYISHFPSKCRTLRQTATTGASVSPFDLCYFHIYFHSISMPGLLTCRRNAKPSDVSIKLHFTRPRQTLVAVGQHGDIHTYIGMYVLLYISSCLKTFFISQAATKWLSLGGSGCQIAIVALCRLDFLIYWGKSIV